MQNLIEVMNGSSVDYTIDEPILYGGVDYESVVNTAYDIRIGGVQNKRISFTCDLNNNTIDEGTHLVYKVRRESTDAWAKVGDFYVDSNTRSDGKTRVTAFDITRKFDTDINDFLDAQTYPMTVSSLFSALCTNFGCTATTPSINASYSVTERPIVSNGLKLLKAIAEVCAGYVYVQSATGNIAIGQFPTPSAQDLISFTSSDYRTFEIDDEVEEIDTVVCGNINGDVTSSATSQYGIYRINFNPLLFNNSNSSAVQTAVDNIQAEIVNVGVPYPCRAYLFDLLTPSGDAVLYAGLQIGISTYKTRIFSIYCNVSGCEIESTGGVKRQDTTITQEEENGIFSSQIKKSEKEISTKVSEVDYNGNTIVSKINQTATTVSVEASKINLNGYTDINGYFSVSNDGKVTMKDCKLQINTTDYDGNEIVLQGTVVNPLGQTKQYRNTHSIGETLIQNITDGTSTVYGYDWVRMADSQNRTLVQLNAWNNSSNLLLYQPVDNAGEYGYISQLGINGLSTQYYVGELDPEGSGQILNSSVESATVRPDFIEISDTGMPGFYNTAKKDSVTLTEYDSSANILNQAILSSGNLIINGTSPMIRNAITTSQMSNGIVVDSGYFIRFGYFVIFTMKVTASTSTSARNTITTDLPVPYLSCGFTAVNFSTGQQNTGLTFYLNKEIINGNPYGRISNIGTVSGSYLITGSYIAE